MVKIRQTRQESNKSKISRIKNLRLKIQDLCKMNKNGKPLDKTISNVKGKQIIMNKKRDTKFTKFQL